MMLNALLPKRFHRQRHHRSRIRNIRVTFYSRCLQFLSRRRLLVFPVVVAVVVLIVVYCYNDSLIDDRVSSDLHFVKGYFGTTKTSTLRLRYDYTNLERYSSVAKRYEAMQTNCSLANVGFFHFDNGAGLGSNLHVYGLGLCVALEMENARMRSHQRWVYRDIKSCGIIPLQAGNSETQLSYVTTTTTKISTQSLSIESPMQCYFPHAEPICPSDIAISDTNKAEVFDMSPKFSQPYNRNNNTHYNQFSCRTLVGGMAGTEIPNVRAATTEFLFTRVSSLVQQEGERQLQQLFGATNGVPTNLITVHIRWGDKSHEMELLPMEKYIAAVKDILSQRNTKKQMSLMQSNKNNNTDSDEIDNASDDGGDDGSVHVYLSTEDPIAVQQFMLLKPAHWKVYLDQYYLAALPNRLQEGNTYNVNIRTAERLGGRTGLIALGSLLVAMEANDFVLTTGSNWSRLMNEIRKNIIDQRCNHCTKMIDLFEGEF